MQQKMTLFNLVAYAVSTLSSRPLLPRWIQDVAFGSSDTEKEANGNPLDKSLLENNYLADSVPIQIQVEPRVSSPLK